MPNIFTRRPKSEIAQGIHGIPWDGEVVATIDAFCSKFGAIHQEERSQPYGDLKHPRLQVELWGGRIYRTDIDLWWLVFVSDGTGSAYHLLEVRAYRFGSPPRVSPSEMGRRKIDQQRHTHADFRKAVRAAEGRYGRPTGSASVWDRHWSSRAVWESAALLTVMIEGPGHLKIGFFNLDTYERYAAVPRPTVVVHRRQQATRTTSSGQFPGL